MKNVKDLIQIIYLFIYLSFQELSKKNLETQLKKKCLWSKKEYFS